MSRSVARRSRTPARHPSAHPWGGRAGLVRWMRARAKASDRCAGDDAMAEPIVGLGKPILALVNDLFFTLKIGDTVKSLGRPIEVAGSAEEFRDKFRRTRPALVIADLTLGGGDMAGLLEEVAADAQPTAV